MHVPNTARKSVVFIGTKDEDDRFTPRGTGFLVAAADNYPVLKPNGAPQFVWKTYLITAEHVVRGISEIPSPAYVRWNLTAGGTETTLLNPPRWWSHPNTKQFFDVAVTPIAFKQEIYDHEYIPLLNVATHVDRIPRLGEEVFIMGLFAKRAGRTRNIPIIRIGNVAAIPEEPMASRAGQEIEAYLIEMRSIAGLSGSPVFKNVEGRMPFPAIVDPRFVTPDRETIDWFQWHFVGLVHGHFDVSAVTDGLVEDVEKRGDAVNTGIGLVVPAGRVLETIFQDGLHIARPA